MRPNASFVGQPIRSLQTMLRVISQAYGKIPTVVPDGIYGTQTLAAITEFQRQNDLPITGITDEATWNKVAEKYEDALVLIGPAEPLEIILDPNETFDLGNNGPYIFLVQSILISLSEDISQIPAPDHNGIYDQKTKEAVAAFQILAGLNSDGILDRITWKNLSRHFTLNAHHKSDRQIRNPQNFTIR